MSPKQPEESDPMLSEIDAALEGVDLQSLEASGLERSAGGPDDPRLHRGTVVGINGNDVIVELGPRVQGVISTEEFEDPPKVGEVFDFSLNGQAEDGLWNLTRRQAKVLAAWNEIYPGARVQARVTGHNTGGLELKIGPLSAFMPASHIDLRRIEDLSTCVDQSFVCEVLEVDRGRKRVLLSRRRVLASEREEALENAVGALQPGLVITGKVTRVEPFGAFVDLGSGVEGLVHVSNMSRRRVEDPNDEVEVGQDVQVQVLNVQEGGKRIGLGMKQLEPDPWETVGHRYRTDQVVTAKVVRLMAFGAFMELEPGLEGLLHVSQLSSSDRPRRPHDLLKEGQELPVRIQEIDAHAQRLSLSRLDTRGAVIGSEDAVESSLVDEVIRDDRPVETNLGSLFRRALEGEDE